MRKGIKNGELQSDLDAKGFKVNNLDTSNLSITVSASVAASLALKEDKSSKGATNGYAPLNSSAIVPTVNLGTGSSGVGSNYLADDGVFRSVAAGSVTFGAQAANLVFSGPTSGGSATPAFRSLVAADLPATAVLSTRTLTAGNGLTGGGDLSADRTFTVGTPSTLTVSSTINSASGTTHSHAVTSSSNPGAAASLLATDASGYLTIPRLTVTDYLFVNNANGNLYLKDTNTGFKAASTTIINPQSGNDLRTGSFASGLIGWSINEGGNAEFANVDVRGAIHASVITYNAIAATAGTLGVFKSAAKLKSDVVVPASPTYTTTTVTVDAVDADGLTHASSQLFVNGDVLRLKDGLIGDTWLKVQSVSDQTTFYRYTCTIQAGTNNVTYRAGLGIADYGLTGQGFIVQTADQTNSPYLQMATHAATFSSADASGTLNVTPQLRLGNLNGSYGYNSDIYGFGTGQYGAASKSWVTVDQTNGLRIGNNSTTLANWDTSGNILVGQTGAGQDNIYVSSGALQIRNGTTVRGQWDSSGGITLGQPGTGNNLTLDSTNGFRVLSGSTVLGQWDTSGNATFGQVATNKSNLYWNNSNQRVEFRGSTSGTTVQSYIDTDGSFVTASGNVKLNSSGLSITQGGSTTNGVTWVNGSNGIIGQVIASGISTAPAMFSSSTGADTTHTVQNEMGATNSSGGSVLWGIYGKGSGLSGAKAYAVLSGNGGPFDGFTVGSLTVPTHMLEVYGTGWFQSTLTAAAGLGITGTVTGTPTWTSSQAITLSTAAQPNITSVGTLTSVTSSGLVLGSSLTASTSAGVDTVITIVQASTASWTITVPASTNAISIAQGGTEFLRISSTGQLKFPGYGAGTLHTDASGNVTAV